LEEWYQDALKEGEVKGREAGLVEGRESGRGEGIA
jgi:predicted transposase YdaD